MNDTAHSAIKAIRQIDNDDDLRMVIDAIKLQRQFISMQNIRALRKGDTVQFTGRAGLTVTGTVEKINRKNVRVRERNSFTVWNVPANMLTQVTEGEMA